MKNNFQNHRSMGAVGQPFVWQVGPSEPMNFLNYANIWQQRYGWILLNGVEQNSPGAGYGQLELGSVVSMMDIITYYEARTDHKGDEIFSLLQALLIDVVESDGHVACENGKILRAIMQLARLPEFQYDTVDEYRDSLRPNAAHS